MCQEFDLRIDDPENIIMSTDYRSVFIGAFTPSLSQSSQSSAGLRFKPVEAGPSNSMLAESRIFAGNQ